MGRHSMRPGCPPVDGADWVAASFSLVGPFEADAVLTAADAVGELVRWLAHATLPARPGVRFAPEVYALLGRLAGTARGFGQVCEQLSARLEAVAADPALRADACDDTGPDPAELARRAAHAAASAGAALADVSAGLDAAQAATSRLYHDEPGQAEDLPQGGGR